MSKEEIIEELKLELNPGSKKVDDLLEMAADLTIQRDELKAKVAELEENVRKEKERGSYWNNLYLKEEKKVCEMRKSMQLICEVSNEICERWKG